jgi:transposase-like protein
VGRSWYVDETYIKVHGQWRYLYRAIDRSGVLVDVMFSEHRDMAAATAFFELAKMVTGTTPDRVTTDGHGSYPRAIRTTLGAGLQHRDNQYLNNRLEQDHRGVRGRYGPMRGFSQPGGSAAAATSGCRQPPAPARKPAGSGRMPHPDLTVNAAESAANKHLSPALDDHAA